MAMKSWYGHPGEESEVMESLSNDVNSISLILDIVDVSVLREGSELEQKVARQLLDLCSRIGILTTNNPSTTDPKKQKQPQPIKNPMQTKPNKDNLPIRKDTEVNIASSWSMLEDMQENKNFILEGGLFMCIQCNQRISSEDLMNHVTSTKHRLPMPPGQHYGIPPRWHGPNPWRPPGHDHSGPRFPWWPWPQLYARPTMRYTWPSGPWYYSRSTCLPGPYFYSPQKPFYED